MKRPRFEHVVCATAAILLTGLSSTVFVPPPMLESRVITVSARTAMVGQAVQTPIVKFAGRTWIGTASSVARLAPLFATLFVVVTERAAAARTGRRCLAAVGVRTIMLGLRFAPAAALAAECSIACAVVRVSSASIEAGWHQGQAVLDARKCWMVKLDKPDARRLHDARPELCEERQRATRRRVVVAAAGDQGAARAVSGSRVRLMGRSANWPTGQ